MGPFRGLGIPNRGACGRGVGVGRGQRPSSGGSGGRSGYQPHTCGLCGHGHVYDTRTGLNNHATKQHGCYYSIRKDAFIPVGQDELQQRMAKVLDGQRHHYPYGLGPRSSRGRATQGRGHGSAPSLLVPPIGRYPRGVGIHLMMPRSPAPA